MDFSNFDIEDLQKHFKRAHIDQMNQQAMRQGMFDNAPPPPNPYAQTEQKSGGWTSIIGPIMGIAKSVGGSGGGGGMGQAFDFLKTPNDDPISIGEVGKSGGMTIPGRRTEAMDISSKGLTVPESSKSFGGGMS